MEIVKWDKTGSNLFQWRQNPQLLLFKITNLLWFVNKLKCVKQLFLFCTLEMIKMPQLSCGCTHFYLHKIFVDKISVERSSPNSITNWNKHETYNLLPFGFVPDEVKFFGDFFFSVKRNMLKSLLINQYFLLYNHKNISPAICCIPQHQSRYVWNHEYVFITIKFKESKINYFVVKFLKFASMSNY